jgi:electron transport complex protein RnfC
MAFSIFGGIHPKDNKLFARDMAILEFPEPDVLVVPLSQHIGAPCQPLVQKGDSVTVGQKIGDGQGLCAPVHSPVSGKVKAIEMHPHTSGVGMLSVVIENDHEQTLCPEIQPRTETQVRALSPEELVEIIHQAGIVGMGGATFPTHVKLRSAMGKVDTVIINASECEPYIVSDERLCRELPGELIAGIKIILKILGVEKAFIAMEKNKPEALHSLEWALMGQEKIQLFRLPAKYPQGAEKQLIQSVTGRQIPSGALPAAVRCAVFNAATCKAISDAVYRGMPLIRRIVTVAGDIVMAPKNLTVPIGTSFQALLEAVGTCENPYKVLSGGPMMGIAQFDLRVPVTKGTNAVTILGHRNRFAVKDSHCIRCGRCMEVCPMHLMPLMMFKAWQSGDLAEMQAQNMMDCMECGCCAYTCPATIPLVQAFRAGKQRIRDAGR